MCQFFSFCSNGKGKYYYFDSDIRQEIREKKLDLLEDSHASIAKYFKVKEDVLNKYEYDPIVKEFKVDQINARDGENFPFDDRENAEAWVKKLDFKTVVPNWEYVEDILKRLKTYKPVNPITATKMPDKKALIKNLQAVWDSVWASVWDSMWSSVRDSVGASVWDSVRDSVRDSVWDSVRASVRASVGDSVWEQSYIAGYLAVKEFMHLDYEHPSFDLIRMGVIVVIVDGKVKVFGNKGKFLGEFDEKEIGR